MPQVENREIFAETGDKESQTKIARFLHLNCVAYDSNVAIGSAECRVSFSSSGVESRSTPFSGNRILELNTNDVIDLRASSTAGLTTIIRILNLSITEL